jgi:ribosome-associated protein
MVKEFSLEGRPNIALYHILKLEGWCESGASAKQAVEAGRVLVNGHIELRKRCKIVAGQLVEFEGNRLNVVE